MNNKICFSDILPFTEMDVLVKQRVIRHADGTFKCAECDYSSKFLHCLKIHIESKHIISNGFSCPECGKHVPTRNALRVHQKRNHM